MNAFLPSFVKISVAGLLLAIGAAHAQPTYSTVEQPSEFGAPQWPQGQTASPSARASGISSSAANARMRGQLIVKLGVQTACAFTIPTHLLNDDKPSGSQAFLQCSDSVAWLGNLVPSAIEVHRTSGIKKRSFLTLISITPTTNAVNLLPDDLKNQTRNLRINLDY